MADEKKVDNSVWGVLKMIGRVILMCFLLVVAIDPAIGLAADAQYKLGTNSLSSMAPTRTGHEAARGLLHGMVADQTGKD